MIGGAFADSPPGVQMSQDEANRIVRTAQRALHSRAATRYALPTAAALGAGAAVAIGSIPSSGGTITACYNTAPPGPSVGPAYGALRLIDPSQSQSTDASVYSCGPKEATITWGAAGPTGPQGSPGAAGPPGGVGAQGPVGPVGGGTTSFGFSSAGGHIWMKLPGIQGEATDKNHKGDIEVNSFSWGATQPGASRIGGGKTTFQSFKVTKAIDKWSPALLAAEVSGTHYKEVDVLFASKAHKGAQHDYIKFKFEDVLISSINANAGGPTPTESLSLNYAKLQLELLAPGGKSYKLITVYNEG